MNSPIEFVTETETLISPWHKPKPATFDDQILKPDYKHLRLKFEEGQTWLRILPALKPSTFSWCMPVLSMNYPGGRFAHPKTLKSNARSVFDLAYNWIKENHSVGLFSKENKGGIRLFPDPLCLFWVIVEIEGKTVPRLLLASGYDGSRGGVGGLGYELWRAILDKDETGALKADAIDPEEGRMIGIKKAQVRGAKYANFSVRVGNQPAPLEPLLEKMTPEDRALLVPLEQVIEELSAEDQWVCLSKMMAPEHLARIKKDMTKAG